MTTVPVTFASAGDEVGPAGAVKWIASDPPAGISSPAAASVVKVPMEETSTEVMRASVVRLVFVRVIC
jgi:hypothetical protein